MLSIYNSLTRKKEPLTPIVPGKLRMYVCGMTVYDYCHIGHARVMVVFDTVVRYLRARGYQVDYIRNITDIDDKIIKRANENNEGIEQLTERFIQAMHADLAALGVLPPSAEPRATLHMRAIVAMIARLIDKSYAYKAGNNDVYYRVRRFAGYGRLSGRSLDELLVGARVEADEAKDDPLDFVLWKAAKPGEPSWESPWGPGRPGWHIECSAMSTHCLGNHFDIHGGGMDLQFPHHENEIAQSEAASGEPFVNLWMHNGFVRVDDEKMSKSLGNFFTIREVLKKYQPEVLRYFILSSHYRSSLNYSDEALENAKAALTRFYIALKDVPVVAAMDNHDDPSAQAFMDAMDDDFNTPVALAVLFDLTHATNKAKANASKEAAHLAGLLRRLGGMLGLLQSDPEQHLKNVGTAALTIPMVEVNAQGLAGLSDAEIDRLISLRVEARRAKNWAESDRIRDELKAQGIILEDGASGTSWRRE
jgi:cysteinyl-tRNA synthetase